MHIREIRLSNFRCFGPEGTTVSLEPSITALIGNNATGKTATLAALAKIFGTTQRERELTPTDFWAPSSNETQGQATELQIEVHIAIDRNPGLELAHFWESINLATDGTISCRLRLVGQLINADSANVDTHQRLYAIMTPEGEPLQDQMREVSPMDRGRIQLIYIPSNRDASKQVVRLLQGHRWRAARWSDDFKGELEGTSSGLNSKFRAETATKVMEQAIGARWTQLHAENTLGEPRFSLIEASLKQALQSASLVFRPDDLGDERPVSQLSDGQKSLAHIALISAGLDLDQLEGDVAANAFGEPTTDTPILTILATEEPENSLSPFYVSRVLAQLTELSERAAIQAIVATHSASALGRIEPHRIRHFRRDHRAGRIEVNTIRLPSGPVEVERYVRSAVRAYPELYFARAVILGEGDSEQLVLPSIAQALNVPLERSFVPVVPLGGRHVEHFWRLLNQLRIPHLTLLDLDMGRETGGVARLKTITEHLLEFHEKAEVFPGTEELAAAEPADLLKLADDMEAIQAWVRHLQSFGVYLIFPLDLDFAMMTSHRGAYRTRLEGQRGPSSRGDATLSVLGATDVPSCYDTYLELEEDFKWYRYLFLGRGKPATHSLAMAQLEGTSWINEAPATLKSIITQLEVFLASA